MRGVRTLLALVLSVAASASVPSGVSPAVAAGTDTDLSTAVSAASTSSTGTRPGGFHALPPNRVLDTRIGLGAARARVAAGRSVTVKVAGRAGVPSTGASGVALTVTAVTPTGSGFVAVHAAGTSLPVGSSLNFTPGTVVPNSVVTRMSADGLVTLDVGGTGVVDLLADVTGYVDAGAPNTPGAYAAVTPSRLLDTRSGLGAPKAAVRGGSTVRLTVAGRGGVPSTGAGAALVNLTVVRPTTVGYVVAAPRLGTTVTTSTINYASGETRANLALVPLSTSGTIDVRVMGSGSAHLVADVVGYLRAGAPTVDSMTSGVSPARLLDTRSTNPVAAGTGITVRVLGRGGVPAAGVGAVLLNVTETAASASGHVTVTAAGAGLSEASNLNFTRGSTHANLVVAPVSSSGEVSLAVRGSGTVHLVADVTGYVLGPPADTTPPAALPALTAVASAKTGIALSWAGVDPSEATGIMIRRLTGGAAPTSPYVGSLVVDTAVTGSSSATTFTDSGLTPGETYSYAAFAHDAVPNFAGSATSTASTTGLVWDSPQSVAPLVGSPVSVSCPSATWCMSVDRSGRAQTWNGTTWAAPEPIGLPQDGTLASLSCPTTTFCVAVGPGVGAWAYRTGTWVRLDSPRTSWTAVSCASATFCGAAGDGAVATFDGSSWSSPSAPTSPTAVTYESISCPTSALCIAVGNSYSRTSQTETGWAARFDGSGWTATTIAASGTYDLRVSCAAATMCMVLGSGGSAIRWNGSAWASAGQVGPLNELIPRALSCASSSQCLVVDPYHESYRWNGAGWSLVPPPPTVSVPEQTMDCPAASLCLLLDSSGRATRWNGSSWSAATVVDPASGEMYDLSCPSDTSCLAMDRRGAAHRLQGTAWSDPDRVATAVSNVSCVSSTWCMSTQAQYPTQTSRVWTGGTWSSPTPTGTFAADVDCVDPSLCFAFDDEGRAVRWDGTSWGAPTQVLSVAGGAGSSLVDCVSRTFCVAVGVSTQPGWSRWNGSGWTPRASLPTSGVSDLSCATTSMCVAVAWTGDSFVWNGSSWRTISATDGGLGGPRSVDCASPVFCVALEYDGTVATFNGTSWSREHHDLGLGRDTPVRIECPSTERCVAIGATLATIAH